MNAVDAGFAAIWRFQVRAERESEFVGLYGADGAWARLFRRSPGYIGTELFKACDVPLTYLTVDYWRSEAAYGEFKSRRASAYAALDEIGEPLTSDEMLLGTMMLAPGPGSGDVT
jgi:heme-degrading monooxygenase HmoA